MKIPRFFALGLVYSLVAAMAAGVSFTPGSTDVVEAAEVFNANRLAEDVVFTSRDAMSVADIQAFLVRQGSILTQVSPADLGANANGRSAAQIIWDAGGGNVSDYGCGGTPPTCPGRPGNPFTVKLNPQVIIATLQKEQSLISGSFTLGSSNLTRALKSAMGMGCPDSGGCDETYYGFANQVTMGAATLWLGYWRATSPANYSNTNPPRRIGDTINFNAVLPAVCNDSRFGNVTIETGSTASLYRYTTGCNGNYNFWYLMNLWFAPAPFKPTAVLIDSGNGLFALVDNVRYPIENMDTFRAFGFVESELRAPTPTEAAYPVGPSIRRLLLDPNGSISYVINGKKHPIASRRTFELRFKWSDVSQPNPVSTKLPYNLPYYELAKTPDSAGIYIMTNGRGYAFPDPQTYANDWGFAWDDFATTPAYTFAPYPLDGTVSRFVKGSGPAVFVMDGGRRMPVISADAFNAWKFDWSMINGFDDRFLGEFPLGPNLTRLAKGSGPAVYYIDNGKKRPISSAAAFNKNGFKWADVSQVSDRLLSTLPDGTAIK